MKYQLATVIVTNAVANNLRNLARMLDKGDMDGMFGVGLSASGDAPATHWISSGYVPKPLVRLMRTPVQMFTVAKAAWEADSLVFPFTQTQVTNALGNCTVVAGTTDSEEPLPESPHETVAALGLKFVVTP